MGTGTSRGTTGRRREKASTDGIVGIPLVVGAVTVAVAAAATVPEAPGTLGGPGQGEVARRRGEGLEPWVVLWGGLQGAESIRASRQGCGPRRNRSRASEGPIYGDRTRVRDTLDFGPRPTPFVSRPRQTRNELKPGTFSWAEVTRWNSPGGTVKDDISVPLSKANSFTLKRND